MLGLPVQAENFVSNFRKRAAYPLLAYRLLTVNDDGFVIYADAGTLAHVGKVIGVSPRAYQANQMVRVQEHGQITNQGWNWAPNALLYLGLNGEIVTNPRLGLFTLPVGHSIDGNTVFLRIGRGIVLS